MEVWLHFVLILTFKGLYDDIKGRDFYWLIISSGNNVDFELNNSDFFNNNQPKIKKKILRNSSSFRIYEKVDLKMFADSKTRLLKFLIGISVIPNKMISITNLT